MLDKYSDFVRPLLDAPPPELWGPLPHDAREKPWKLVREKIDNGLALGRVLEHAVRTLGRDAPEFASFLLSSATRVLDRWFQSDVLKATLATDAVIGAWTGPGSPESAYVFLHHVMCGSWYNVEGGMGALTQALLRVAKASGKVDVLCDAPVKRFLLDNPLPPANAALPAVERRSASGSVANDESAPAEAPNARIEGVQLVDGRTFTAPLVLSTAAPETTFMHLIDTPSEVLPPSFHDTVRHADVRSGVVKINCALDRLPSFHCKLPRFSPAPGSPAAASLASLPPTAQDPALSHLRGTIHFERSICEIEKAFADTAHDLPSQRPVIEMTIPSVQDPSIAPPGKHVALLFVQYAPHNPRPDWREVQRSSSPSTHAIAARHGASDNGRNAWDAPGAREAFADRVFSVIDEYAPGFSSSVIGRDILTPPDLERVFGLPGGNIFQSGMSLDQLYWLRPAIGYARHRTPVQGLYLAGAGAHPGGGVMGAAGHNAALQVLRDIGLRQKELDQISSVPKLRYD